MRSHSWWSCKCLNTGSCVEDRLSCWQTACHNWDRRKSSDHKRISSWPWAWVMKWLRGAIMGSECGLCWLQQPSSHWSAKAQVRTVGNLSSELKWTSLWQQTWLLVVMSNSPSVVFKGSLALKQESADFTDLGDASTFESPTTESWNQEVHYFPPRAVLTFLTFCQY